jgi:phosphopantetheinyl transferase (holo-ACP synthase)
LKLGNDIVDLRFTADHHPRFSDRVLRPSEKEWVAREGAHSLWYFWAAKEAAFKAHGQSSKTVFHPLDWAVDLRQGVVHYQDGTYFLRLMESPTHVRAICSSEATYELSEGIYEYPGDVSSIAQSAGARDLLRSICRGKIDDNSLVLEGIPHSTQARCAVSISHHGQWLHAVLGKA